MFGFVKMAALSAVLSYGLVTAYGPTPAAGDVAPAKLYKDRILPAGEAAPLEAAVLTTGSVGTAERVSPAGKGDRLGTKPDCSAQTWPYISAACTRRTEGSVQPKSVRVITIESRIGADTSMLTRVSHDAMVQR